MSRKRRGPSLLRTVARTAAISSTATATSRAVSNVLEQKAMRSQQEQAAAMQAQAEMEPMNAGLAGLQTTQAGESVTPPAQTDLLTQLTQLAQLKEAGALSEEEFQLAKAKILR